MNKLGLMSLIGLISVASGTIPFSAQAKQQTLTLVHYWGGVEHSAFLKVAEAYTKKNPNIKIKVVSGATNELMLAMMAGGNPPDVLIIDEWVASWALRGILQPLDKYIKASGISKDDFWQASWKECEWEGKTYALPWFSDPNFAMYYNKTVFSQVGLPDRAPETLSEFEMVDAKVSIRDAVSGKYKRIAFPPHMNFGSMANTVYQWGWIFGGDFYDERNKKLTVNDPRIVRSLEWMQDYLIKRGGTGAYAGVSGFEQQGNCMAPYIGGSVVKFKFDHGVGNMPRADGVAEPSEWVGGQKIAIPVGAKNPQAAWDFLKYIAASKEGTETYCNTAKARFVSYKPCPAYDRFRKDPDLSHSVKLLEKAVHQRPIIPVAEFLVKQLTPVVSQVVDKKQQPKAILATINDLTQKQLNTTLTRFKKK